MARRGSDNSVSPRPGAFTLTEMLVALAVMIVAMAIVTNVFSVTAKTAAISAAVSEAETIARNFALQIEEDLRNCDPSQSVLVLVGRTQAAALTEDLRQAGQYYRVLVGDPNLVDSSLDPRFNATPPPEYSDPRADVLMFFTQRPSVSQAPPVSAADDFGRSLQRGAKVSPVQVVYGHAALDRAVRTGNGWAFADDLVHIERDDPARLSRLPLTRWHLARRAALISDTSNLGPASPNPPSFLGSATGTADSREYPRILRCVSDDPRYAGDAVYYRFGELLEWFSPDPPVSGFGPVALRSPYGVIVGSDGYVPFPALMWTGPERYAILSLLYPQGDETYHHVATIVEEPPPALSDNLAIDLVPGCAWFQVEFLMPEDPRNSRAYPLPWVRGDGARWVAVPPGATYVFVPDTDENRTLVEDQVYPPGHSRAGLPLPNPNRLRNFSLVIPRSIANALPSGYQMAHNGDTADNRIVRMWPYAIRVTIRVIDHNGRLPEPVVRSVVHWFE